MDAKSNSDKPQPAISQLLSIEGNPETIDDLLRQAGSRNGIIPFVGAGMSVPFGFPTWAQFLYLQAAGSTKRERIENLIASNQLEDAAEQLLAEGANTLQLAIQHTFGEKSLPPDLTAAVSHLPYIASGPVITTNFDHVLERVFNAANKPFSEIIYGIAIDRIRNVVHHKDRALIKIHGDADDRSERVFTASEYQKRYQTNEPLSAVLPFLMTNPLLFIGCSLESDRIVHVLETVATELRAKRSEALQQHFAVVQQPRDATQWCARKCFFEKLGVRPIWYPEGRHDLIETLLNYLQSPVGRSEEVRKRRRVQRELARVVRGDDFLAAKTSSILLTYSNDTFYGRSDLLQRLDSFVNRQHGGLLLVTGPSGYGKTALLANWLKNVPSKFKVFYHFFRTDDPFTRDVIRVYRNLTRFLYGVLDELPPDNLNRFSFDELQDEIVFVLGELRQSLAGTKLVIVLDGLDEAEEEIFAPPFERKFLDGIHVITTVRTSDKTDPPALDAWKKLLKDPKGDRIRLERLSKIAIKDWVASSKSHPQNLKDLACFPRFIDGLADKSEGSPAYIRDLLKDFVENPDFCAKWEEVIRDIPPGYENYVRSQFQKSCEIASATRGHDGTRLENLAALLVAAKAPLGVSDLQEIGRIERTLDIDVYSLPAQTWRWLTVSPADGIHGRTLSFANQLAHTVLTRELLDPTRRFSQLLLNHCRHFATNRSEYAARFLVAHLTEEEALGADRWFEIEQTVTSNAYLQLLKHYFQEDTTLPLQLVQESLRYAIHRDDITGIAECTLAHVELAARLRYPNPGDVAEFSDWERAQHFGKILLPFDPAIATMWKLLGIYKQHKCEPSAATALSPELFPARRVMLQGVWADLASAFLVCTLRASAPHLGRLCHCLLDDAARADVAQSIATSGQRGGFDSALRIAWSIKSKTELRRGLCSIFEAMVERRQWTFAFDEMDKIEDLDLRGLVLVELSRFAAEEIRDLQGTRDLLSHLEALADHVQKQQHFQPAQRTLHWHPIRFRTFAAQAKLWLGAALLRKNKTREALECFTEAKGFAYSKHTGAISRFNVLITYVESQIQLLDTDSPCRPNGETLLAALNDADNAWQELDEESNNSNVFLLHSHLRLLRVTAELMTRVPDAAPYWHKWTQRFHYSERRDFLSPQDKDDLTLHFIRYCCSAKEFDESVIRQQLKIITDPGKKNFAYKYVLERLRKENRLQQTPTSFGIPEPIAQAYLAYVHLKNGNHELAGECWERSLQLGLRRPPKLLHYNLTNTLAQVGASLQFENKQGSHRCLKAAMRLACARDHGAAALYLVGVAEAAHTAGQFDIRDEALANAQLVADKQTRYRPKSIALIRSWCAIAILRENINVGSGDELLKRTYALIQTWTGFARKAGGFAEIAEARARINDNIGADQLFQSMESFIYRQLLLHRGVGARREATQCLVELVAGLVKARRYAWALRLYNTEKSHTEALRFYDHDEARRALAVAFAYQAEEPGSVRASDAMVKQIGDPSIKSRALRDIAILHIAFGRPRLVQRAISAITHNQDRDEVLHRVARAFVEHHNKVAFQRIIPLCAWSFGEACLMLELVARMWPKGAQSILNVLDRHGYIEQIEALKQGLVSVVTDSANLSDAGDEVTTPR